MWISFFIRIVRVRQIRDKNYLLRFRGKLGEAPKYTGRILLVGISYQKKTKKHSCRVEAIERKVT